jgi:solute carrier family 6 GABA transporter-like protein 1
LEVSIGQAYRGGTVIAFNNIDRRLKGVGLGSVIVCFLVVQYFTVNLAWIPNYFRWSFTSPLPWENRIEEFYWTDVLKVGDIVEGSLTPGGNSVAQYQQYPHRAIIGETIGWSILIWFLIWISIFRGVGMTGRVVYFTMGLPIVTTIIFVGRALSLENDGEGVACLADLERRSARVWNRLADGHGPSLLLHRYRLRLLYELCQLQSETLEYRHGCRSHLL